MYHKHYEYDACNRVRTVTDQAGGQTAYTYDFLTGKITAITDPAGNSRTFTYNEAGELIEETDIRGNKTTYTYTLLGKPATITDPSGRTTTHHYEQGGRLKQTNYPDGNTMIYTYDALGRVETKTDGNDYGLRYHYDAMGRIQTVTSTTGQEKSYTYDALGNVTAETDANGNETTYRYNSAGNLITHTDPLGNQTTYTYGQGSLLSQITQEGTGREEPRSTTYERNTLGQVTAVTDPLGHMESYTYDALGRIIKKIDKEGNDTEYTYTAFDKPERIQYADGTQVELQYTPLRQLARIKDWLGETTIQRNKQGDPISITDHTGTTISYEWGAYGERKNTVYPDGSTVRYEYDAMLRLKQMVTNDAANGWNTTTYQYDRLGRLKEKNLPGGVDTIWSYNEQGLPAQFIHQDQRGILDSYRFAYDAMGNKIEIQKKRQGLPEESGTYAYTYDTLNRLTGVEKDQKSLRSYAYDSFGNRTEMTDDKTGCKTAYTYNAGNQLLSEELWNTGANLPQPNIKKTYTYDNRGNITGEYRNDAILHTYTYNAMNRLAAATDEMGTQALYHYNGLGQRVGRNEETYLLDLTKPCQNLLGVKNGGHSQQYYWDHQPVVMRDERKNIRYFLNDELGSPLRLRYDTGKEDKYGYDEFGNDLFDPEAKEYINRYTRHGEIQPFGYTGYRYDDISGTYFAQAREYQPGKGRFTAEDVLRGNSAVPMTLNRYGYCWNQPLNFADVDGKFPWIIIPVVLLGAAALSGCGIKEEDLLPMPPASGDYEFVNSPEVYNSKEYLRYTNCYAYALDVVKNPLTNEKLGKQKFDTVDWGLQPGMLTGRNIYDVNEKIIDIDKEFTVKVVREDAEAINIKLLDYEDGIKATGGYWIAIALSPSPLLGDYHLYRQDKDGTWSGKSGGSKVITGIKNPQAHAYNNDYPAFVGYFYLVKEGCE